MSWCVNLGFSFAEGLGENHHFYFQPVFSHLGPSLFGKVLHHSGREASAQGNLSGSGWQLNCQAR